MSSSLAFLASSLFFLKMLFLLGFLWFFWILFLFGKFLLLFLYLWICLLFNGFPDVKITDSTRVKKTTKTIFNILKISFENISEIWMESPRLLFSRLFFLSVHFQVLFLNQVSTSSNIVWKEFCSLTRGQRSTESLKVVWSYVGNSYDTKSWLRFLLRWPKERSLIPIVCLLRLGLSIDKCEIILLVSPFCVCLTVVFVGYTWVSAGLKKAIPRQERLKNRWLAMKWTEVSIA